MALGHGDALQRGCPGALGSADRGDDAPSRERGREAPVSPGPRPGRARLRGAVHTRGLRGPRHRPWGPRATKARPEGTASQSPSRTLPGSQTSQAQPGVRTDGPCLWGVPSDPADPEPEVQMPPGQSRVGEAPELGGSSATLATPGRGGADGVGGAGCPALAEMDVCAGAHTPAGTSSIRPVAAIRAACSVPREGRPGPAGSSCTGLERPCLPASRRRRPVLSGPGDPATPQPAEALRRKSLFSVGVSGNRPQPH